MPIAALLIIFAGSAAIAVLYPHLRLAAVLVMALVGALFASLLFTPGSETDSRTTRIPVSELILSDLDFTDDERLAKLSGKVTNGSDSFTLRGMTIGVDVLDCPNAEADKSDCTVIASDTGEVFANVPAGQARSFSLPLRFPNRPEIEGVLVWQHSLIQTDATR